MSSDALVHNITVTKATSDNEFAIILFGKAYRYLLPANFSAISINNEINTYKRWKDLNSAGRKISYLLKSIEPYLIKDDIIRKKSPKLNISEAWGDMIDRHQYDQKIVARDESGNYVGHAIISYMSDEKGVAYIKWIEVAEDKRRQGIATAIYDWIKKTQGITEIKRFGDVGTPDGNAFRDFYTKSASKCLDTQLLCCGYPKNRRKDPYKKKKASNWYKKMSQRQK